MTRPVVGCILAAIVSSASGCRPSDSEAAQATDAQRAVLAERDARLTAALLAKDTVGAQPEVARWLLPDNLYEISGIALTADGRMLVHGDQSGIVTEIDYRRGIVTKQFKLGKETLKGDFEGITIANGRVFLLESNGTLYEFAEGDGGARVDYTVHDTKLGKECEFEGVTYDSTMKSLVLVCKEVLDKSAGDSLVFYRWKLGAPAADQLTRFTVGVAHTFAEYDWKKLRPSDITVDPLTGNYVLVSSQEGALISVTPAGKLVFVKLLVGVHAQAEGLAITSDGILVIADEAGQAKAGERPSAMISLYRWPGVATSGK